ncbi:MULTISPECIES: L,D-transpeptidase family protein [Clostridia]|uniref:L,D-transpeptidase family protein n=1 Tax=Clostridia TaxID=186801 RepID=UPI000E4C5EE5|nr:MULTISPECIES: L,D-transpeptidase family protein [Clostridia]RGH41534.1 hypothetical protein DW901_00355 [Firmicutes bacterium AM41-5BH]RHV08077.1 hypothetical protein DXB97_01790 [Firmicutes bacterium OM07-11]RKQ32062.1 hypothetical protein D8Q48_02085 [Ruminococcus sp. B05]TAP36305.1 hypothetical protein EYA86_02085 [Mediterraneibacter sp. gm002]
MKQKKITKSDKEKIINNTDFKETDEFTEVQDDAFEEVDDDLENDDDAFEEVDESAETEENDFTEADVQGEEVSEEVENDNIEEWDAESENEDLFTSQDDFTSEIINLDDKTDKEKNKKGKKLLWITLGSIAGVIAIVYLGISIFFMSHYYINTEINGHDFSMKTAADVEKYMKDQVKNYSLTVLEMEQAVDIIEGDTIDLEYKASDEAEAAIKDQNAFLWPTGIFSKKSCQIELEVSYDESKLQQEIQNLQTVTREQIEPKSAYPKFDGNQFVIEPEEIGTAVDRDVLNEKINQYITEFKSELDMEKEGCYKRPVYTSNSKEVKAACDEMNKYLQASITYTMTENVVVDKSVINSWVTVDDNMKVSFNENAVRDWLTAFGDKYDTVGATRTITTPTGKTVEVSGGTYGWSIDEDTEFTALTNSIKNGEVVTKEPAYYQTAASHSAQDWGDTYAEVDISAQHMWYISGGSVVLETDVVTGEPIPEKETTLGVYDILEKSLNKTLVGEDNPVTGKPIYETPVSYWMRVTWSGIGFHDAIWQPAFGGTLYRDGLGSHGCINMPLDMAAALYNVISVGTPVIVHN